MMSTMTCYIWTYGKISARSPCHFRVFEYFPKVFLAIPLNFQAKGRDLLSWMKKNIASGDSQHFSLTYVPQCDQVKLSLISFVLNVSAVNCQIFPFGFCDRFRNSGPCCITDWLESHYSENFSLLW